MESEIIKILAIDDTLDNLITLKALIIEAFPEAKIITATSGEVGIELAISENPDVILLDIIMPDMDGFEVCRKLKTIKITNNIPVVFVTALKGDSESRIKALEVGAEAFIAKPIDQSELVAQIRAMAKIKSSQELKLNETARLAALVAERTRELNANHIATLNLLEDLKQENEARRKTEEALRTSEEKYRFMTENSSDVIWHLDANFVCDYISPSDERMRGFHQDEVIGTSLFSILKPEGIENVKRVNAARLADEKNHVSTGSIRYELEQLCKDGSWIWTEANASIHYNEEGEIIGYHGASRDITERKRAQDALWESEEKYRTLIQYSSDPIFSYNRDNTYRFVNEAFAKAFEMTPAEIIGKTPHAIMSHEEAEKRLAFVYNVFQTKQKGESEVKLVQSTGDKQYYLTMADPIFDSEGEVAFVTCISKNITERKLAEKALKVEKRKIETYLNIAQVILVAFDKDGNITLLNKKGYQVLGYEPGELINKNWFNTCVPLEEIDSVKQVFEQIILGKAETFNYHENQIITKSGESRTIAWNNTWVTDINGNIIGALSSGEDITERKKAEEALRMSEEKYSTVFQTSPYAITITSSSESKILDVNDAFTSISGYSREEALQNSVVGLNLWTNNEDREFVISSLQKNKSVNSHEFIFQRKDGTFMTGLYSAQMLFLDGETLILSSINDITDRKIAEEQLQHVGRLYALLSQINQAIVRTEDRFTLLQTICEVAVQYGQFKMAWIGIVDESTEIINPVCHAGHEEGYLKNIVITRNDDTSGKGPVGRSIRENTIKISHDIATDPNMEPWREEALKRGYRSSIAVPFKIKNKVIGTINLYASELGFFSEDEKKLLQEIGEDISFALDAMEAESERVQTEMALQESELKYREFVENSPEAISIYADGKIVYVNKECVRLMRAKSKDELVGLSVIEYIHPDNRETVIERMKVVAQSDTDGSLPLVEEKYIRMDGTPMYVEVKAMPILLDGEPAVQLTARDISDRKMTEEALENSRKELKAIYDYAPVMMCVVDEKGGLLFANNAFTSFTKSSSLKIKGGSPGDVFGCVNSFIDPRGCGHAHACSSCVLRNAINSTFKTGKGTKNIEYESVFLHGNDQKPVSLLCSTALINNAGQKNLLLCLHDITDRKRAEENLLSSEARLESMFEYSPISIWEEDFSLVKKELEQLKHEGVTDFRKFLLSNPTKIEELVSMIKVVSINETSIQIFGTESKEEILVNLNHFFSISNATINVFSEEMIALAEGRTQFEGETQIMTLNGEKKNLLLTLTVMPDFEDTLSKVLISFIDITQRKEAEDALQKSEMFLRTFIENTPFEIWARDINGIGILENKKLVDHFGSILGQKPEHNTHDSPEVLRLWELNNSRAYNGELIDEIVQYNLRNQSLVYQQIIFPIQDEKHIIGIAGFNIDITERVRAEEELKRSENALNRQNELFTLLLKNLPVGVFMVEAPSGKPIMANDAAMQLLGRGILPDTTPENLAQIYNTYKVGSREHYPVGEMPIYLGMHGISAHIDDMVVIRPDGSQTLLEIFGSPVTDNYGNIWASLVSFTDITERKNAEVTLKNSQEQLKQFAAHLQNVREDERTGLAREIHDDLGQILVALKIDMGLLKNKVVKEFDGKMNSDVMIKFDNLVGLIDNTIKTTRRIMTGLRPEVLEMLGFIEAAKLYTKDFEERHKIRCVFESSITTLDVAPQQSVALFRILQEALTNVVRHAKATQVTVQLLIENNILIMEIVDNGIGFPKNHKVRNDSYGLIGMNERVFLLEGELIIEGRPGEGTIVRIEMPYTISI
ncbi:MAG: PAS domain S-box protein [Paludibacter sp.]|nr:PAS domain S-box protein [Paludibacter sp.]